MIALNNVTKAVKGNRKKIVINMGLGLDGNEKKKMENPNKILSK